MEEEITKNEDVYVVDHLALSLVVARYRMADGKPRRISQTVYQNISLLPSDNINDDAWIKQIKNIIYEYENKSREEDQKKES